MASAAGLTPVWFGQDTSLTIREGAAELRSKPSGWSRRLAPGQEEVVEGVDHVGGIEGLRDHGVGALRQAAVALP
jgi:hypothetical protein